jgi:hypothetical protein
VYGCKKLCEVKLSDKTKQNSIQILIMFWPNTFYEKVLNFIFYNHENKWYHESSQKRVLKTNFKK